MSEFVDEVVSVDVGSLKGMIKVTLETEAFQSPASDAPEVWCELQVIEHCEREGGRADIPLTLEMMLELRQALDQAIDQVAVQQEEEMVECERCLREFNNEEMNRDNDGAFCDDCLEEKQYDDEQDELKARRAAGEQLTVTELNSSDDDD